MTLTTADIAAPIAAYARRLHAVAGTGHQVLSPLGAWLLLALLGPASSEETRPGLNAALGCDVAGAAELAAGLLTDPHPVVPAAAAVWHAAGVTGAVARWLAGLPAAVETGPVPDQAGADRWARDHTLGLIKEFPVRIDPSVWLVAATALATRVSWERPFDVAPASALGPASPWVGRLSRVLRTPDGPGHQQFIAATKAAGDVAVHTARAQHGLQVTSVIAAPGVEARDVLAAAYDLAPELAAGAAVRRRSLFDLPLGNGPAWTISERTEVTTAGPERCTAVLPAWSARSEQDLSDHSLGFAAAISALAPGDPWEARQAAMARYNRTGFEAAAVTGAVAAMAMRVPRPSLIRSAELRFGHPYAVVAAVTGPGPGQAPAADGSPWAGLPVFSAWVAQPEDADPED
ncbi:MAG TPA: hypothetical protein VHY31_15600 [Streptosporangiaceae bacterium]|nr:hypothetical protein [Streptosporangiaceae bacterium]